MAIITSFDSDLAGRCGAAPHRLNFGDSAARLVRGLLTLARDAQQIGDGKSESSSGLVRLPGIAPGHAPWREAILLLNHNRGN